MSWPIPFHYGMKSHCCLSTVLCNSAVKNSLVLFFVIPESTGKPEVFISSGECLQTNKERKGFIRHYFSAFLTRK